MTKVPATPLLTRSSKPQGAESSTVTLRAPTFVSFQVDMLTGAFGLTISVTLTGVGLLLTPATVKVKVPWYIPATSPVVLTEMLQVTGETSVLVQAPLVPKP